MSGRRVPFQKYLNRIPDGRCELTSLPNKPIFAMVLPCCRGRAIGDNAIRRAEAISSHFRPVIISDSFPDQVSGSIETILIDPKRFDYLRRFCHVPNEIAFATAARAPLEHLAKQGQLGFVLAHGYSAAYFAGLWLRRKRGTPFGMFMHGHIFERPKGTYDPRITRFYRRLAPHCYGQADLLFALSRDQGKLAVKAGAPAERVVIAPNGLDLEDIGLSGEQVRDKIETFDLGGSVRGLFVGRLNPEKGVEVLLRACAMLKEVQVNFSLDIVGGGPLENDLRNLCTDLQLEPHLVKFHGSLGRKDLGETYLEHHIQFVPSISEPLGNVVHEGLASGCLVVASETGGIPDMITDGVNGVLVQPGSPRQIFDAVLRLIERRASAKSMIEAGFNWHLNFGSWKRIGLQIIEATNPVIRSHLVHDEP